MNAQEEKPEMASLLLCIFIPELEVGGYLLKSRCKDIFNGAYLSILGAMLGLLLLFSFTFFFWHYLPVKTNFKVHLNIHV